MPANIPPNKITHIPLRVGDPEPPPDVVFGPDIGENASKRVDDVTVLDLTPEIAVRNTPATTLYNFARQSVELSEVPRSIMATNVVITNLPEYGRIAIDYDLVTPSGISVLDTEIWLTRSQEDYQTQSKAMVTPSEASLSPYTFSATGDIGTIDTAITHKHVVMDITFGLDNLIIYDTILIVYVIADVTRLLIYEYYPIISDNTSNNVTLNF